MKTSDIEIYDRAPEGFAFQVQVAACYLEIDNKLLLLQRAFGEFFEPEKWGVPAGKLESHETPENAAKRELFEETGISLETSSETQRLHSLYIRKPEIDYVFHQFKVQLGQMPDICLSNEHQNYKWATSKDIEQISLMDGAKETLQHYRAGVFKKSGAHVNAYLILRQNQKVLFHLRKNTGYCDGMWSLVAGHVEDGESATTAMLREANEELGIELNPSQVNVVHIMHRQSTRNQ